MERKTKVQQKKEDIASGSHTEHACAAQAPVITTNTGSACAARTTLDPANTAPITPPTDDTVAAHANAHAGPQMSQL